jgi:thiamine-monophosphate kinase
VAQLPSALTLADVGESGLLARMLPLLGPGAHTLVGPGDDTAVVAATDGRVVATTDVLVQGRDFRLDWSGAQDIGAKAAAANLADVAAMGARPTALLVALVAPPTLACRVGARPGTRSRAGVRGHGGRRRGR